MTFFVTFIFFIVVPLALMKFMFNFNHLLVSLFTLEFISLGLFAGLALSCMQFSLESVFMLYFLVMLVCEGVLGLCLLVLISFSHGGDYLFSLNKLKC